MQKMWQRNTWSLLYTHCKIANRNISDIKQYITWSKISSTFGPLVTLVASSPSWVAIMAGEVPSMGSHRRSRGGMSWWVRYHSMSSWRRRGTEGMWYIIYEYACMYMRVIYVCILECMFVVSRYVYVCVCLYLCVCACMCACLYIFIRICMRMYV